MEDYQKMYTYLFNEVTTSIELLSRQKEQLSAEIDRLKYAQCRSEEIFIQKEKLQYNAKKEP